MIPQLPANLFEAEDQFFSSLSLFLETNDNSRISINIKLEGLRILPVVIRLFKKLEENNVQPILLWPDAGATALAKRDAPELSNYIKSFNDLLKGVDIQIDGFIFLAISPQHYDYEEFEAICTKYSNKIVMFNGKLDDAAVGIGSVARQRRKNFISKWTNIYWLEPIAKGAILHSYPEKWRLYRLYSDGYRPFSEFSDKPSPEAVFEAFLN